MIVAEAESPPAVKRASCPLLFRMEALRKKFSFCSTMLSLIIVMSQEGVDTAPGPLPAANETVHVVPTKSAPSVVQEIVDLLYYDDQQTRCCTKAVQLTIQMITQKLLLYILAKRLHLFGLTCSSVTCLSTSCDLFDN